VSEKLAFKETYRGYSVEMYWGEGADARGIVTREQDGKKLLEFSYPAYKIFNIQAHWSDIVDGELQGDKSGWAIAGSDGLGGMIMPQEKQ